MAHVIEFNGQRFEVLPWSEEEQAQWMGAAIELAGRIARGGGQGLLASPASLESSMALLKETQRLQRGLICRRLGVEDAWVEALTDAEQARLAGRLREVALAEMATLQSGTRRH